MSAPDLNQLPCPARVIDGVSSPTGIVATAVSPGVVRIAVTATSAVVLGVRKVPAALPGLVVPALNGTPIPTVDEVDVRFVPVERVLIDLPVEFVAGDLARILAAAIDAASTSQNGDPR